MRGNSRFGRPQRGGSKTKTKSDGRTRLVAAYAIPGINARVIAIRRIKSFSLGREHALARARTHAHANARPTTHPNARLCAIRRHFCRSRAPSEIRGSVLRKASMCRFRRRLSLKSPEPPRLRPRAHLHPDSSASLARKHLPLGTARLGGGVQGQPERVDIRGRTTRGPPRSVFSSGGLASLFSPSRFLQFVRGCRRKPG